MEEEQKRCDTCRHEKDQWFLKCADCFDYELWEEKEKEVSNNSPELDNNFGDLISRQAAIDAINQICPIDTEYDCTLLDRVDVRCVLTDLPSAQPEVLACGEGELIAQPERKRGKWIEQEDSWDGVYYECSACGEPWTTIDGTPWDNGMKFCPNCGASMMEGQDDSI